MKIYTKTGDSGKTSLLGGTRVSKSNLRIHAYGTVDELNAYLGLLRDQDVTASKRSELIAVQQTLFSIGSNLALENKESFANLPKITESEVIQLEHWIDEMDKVLPPLRNFILPGGHPSVSISHVARVTCRKAERMVTELHEVAEVEEHILKFLNRLSDYLFVLGRWIAQELQVEEIAWKPR